MLPAWLDISLFDVRGADAAEANSAVSPFGTNKHQ